MTRYREAHYSQLIVFLFSVLYAGLFAAMRSPAITDRINYLVYAQDSLSIAIRFMNRGYVSFFSNEPVWLGINILLGSLLSPYLVIAVISFFSAYVSSYVALRRSAGSIVFIFVILFLPQIFKNNVVHIRQGLAVAFFLLGSFSDKKSWKKLMFILSMFTHTSFVFLVFFYVLNGITRRFRFAFDMKTVVFVVSSLAISFGALFLASVLGARQGSRYVAAMPSVSGLGLVFWSAVLVLIFLEGKDFIREYSFEFSLLVFYVVAYLFFPVAARIFESVLLLLCLVLLRLSSWRLIAFKTGFICYWCLMVIQRLSLPGFGWNLY